MRAVIAFLSFGAAAASIPAADVKAIVGGLVDGFLNDPAVKQCVQDSHVEIKDLEQAIQNFEKEDATDVLNGLRLLGAGLQTLPDALTKCKASEEDVKKIATALEQFHSPMSFVYHAAQDLWVNHKDILAEITKASVDYKSQQFEDFGVQVGLALNKVVVGVPEKFEQFVQMHNKSYFTESERQHRMAVFAKNHDHINKLQHAEEGTAVYSHMSPFADLTPEEFAARNGFRFSADDKAFLASTPMAEPLDVADVPDAWDWRSKGAVNPIKNQAQCGSCWAFSAVANIEGAGFVETGKLVSLSEQDLVDCDHETGDQGCQGGLPANAFQDMITNKFGLETESAYPYTASNGKCKAVPSKEVAFVSGFQRISTDETQIAAALVKYGPLSIGINASPMQFYHGGIANPWSFLCNPHQLDHGVAIVGFGAEKSMFGGSKKYWIIRNSWGVTWGEKGYYRIIRGVGKCGLNTGVTTATGIKIKSEEQNVVV